MNIAELNQTLHAHANEMQSEIPGCLYYGILKITDGTIVVQAKAQGNPLATRIEEGASYHVIVVNQLKQILSKSAEDTLILDMTFIETDKIVFVLVVSDLEKFFSITAIEKSKANLGVTRAILTKCKMEYGPILDSVF